MAERGREKLVLLTTVEVAQIAKTSKRTIQQMIRTGQLKAQKFGKGYRVREEDLLKLFEDPSIGKPPSELVEPNSPPSAPASRKRRG
jgi:excisionase family DNA binding protein